MTNTIQHASTSSVSPSHRRPVPALIGSIAIIGANSLSLGPIAPDIADGLATVVTRVMWAGGAYGAATAIGALVIAPWIDRLGARRMLLLALAALAIAFAVSAVAVDVTMLVAAQALAGLAAGAALPSIYAFAALVAPPGRESAVVGQVLVGWTVSMVAGVALAAVIADLAGWRTVYGILTTGAILACLAIAASPERGPPRAPSSLYGQLAVLANPEVRRLLLVCFAFMTAFYGVYSYLGDHVHRALALPVSAMGIVALAYGTGFGAAAVADPLIDRFGWRRLMAPAYAVVAGVYLLLGLLGQSYAAVVAVAAAWGIANHFGLNLIVSGLSSLDPGRRGTILGLNSAVTYVAVSVGTLAFGPLYERVGLSGLALVAAGACLLASVITLGLAPKDR
jgi:predicted MFS family arabinose efflux permease